MSQSQIQSMGIKSQSFENEFKSQENRVDLVAQIIHSSLFRIMLKDIVSQMYTKEGEDQEIEKESGGRLMELQSLVQEIGNSLLIMATTQASKQVKQAEKFLAEMYQFKVKELESRFEQLIDKKIKQVQQRMQKFQTAEMKQSSESLVLRAIRFSTEDRCSIQANEQEIKRLQLKQKILNSSASQETRSSLKLEGVASSLFSSSLLNDGTIEKLSQKIKSIEQNFKAEIKLINEKMTSIRVQTKSQIEQSEEDLKEQLNSGFEGIWNVISNLEKRMAL